jgi:homoserine kinase
MRFRLRAPATSANLGPGFDCLGLALDLWNEVEVECLAGEGVVDLHVDGEGAAELPVDESHLLLRVAFDYLRQNGITTWPRLRISCLNRLPLARGLGSSAATRVLGVMLGQRLRGSELDRGELLHWASRHEGHPDNVAPAVFGGLCASLADTDGRFHSQPWPVHPSWRVVVAIPSFVLETERSRAALPTHLERADAVFNLARLPWLLRGLAEGRADWVSLGCQDRWHQRQRAGLIPGMDAVFGAAARAGACATYLSGAGPTLAALVDARDADADGVAAAMEQAWHGQARCRVLGVVGQGAHVLHYA